ncbi:excisionase Xis [Buttiauxella sp. S04-F03]|uniref:excisionase Xis n=1 Tax=Buttiauxella sp. W03-F01 TaxID=2904524 RepID=UPI001E2D6D3D|nr:excisionase Xis [Buttiauxella sp. W03-F01]MCE0802026.1 excisionase Xis [Buttiauxella sp. W03-F01]
MTDNESWMDTKRVCDFLCISTRTLARYRNKSENPFPEPDYSCMGASNRWKRAQVVAWQTAEQSLPKRKPLEHIHRERDIKGRVTSLRAV